MIINRHLLYSLLLKVNILLEIIIRLLLIELYAHIIKIIILKLPILRLVIWHLLENLLSFTINHLIRIIILINEELLWLFGILVIILIRRT